MSINTAYDDITWVYDDWRDDLEYYLGDGTTIASHALARLISSKGRFVHIPDKQCPNGRNHGYEIAGVVYYFRYVNDVPHCRKGEPV